MGFLDFDVVIVNWNLKKDTAECIDSLINAGVNLKQITLVDNGSTDPSIDFFIEKYGPDLRLIETGQNLGFASGVNIGVQTALERGVDWILLINNDTHVAQDFLEKLSKAAAEPPYYQIIGPAIYYHSQPDRLWFLAERQIDSTLISINRYRGHELPPGLPDLIPSDFLNGCCMLINKEVFEKIGLLDHSLFMYGEEVDFCLRARLAGFKLGCATRAAMWHKISASSNKDQPRARYFRVRNQIWIYRRYARTWHRSILFLFTMSRSIWMTFTDLAARQPGLIQPLYRGFWDGWTLSVPMKE